MYRISQLARLTGLSRSALLYYEKIGLLVSERQNNGYRLYSEKSLQRIQLLLQLRAGGLTLKECKACLNDRMDKEILEKRLAALDAELNRKQQSRELLAAMLGITSSRKWHNSIESLSPEAHTDWLETQGYDEKQALRLKWLSQDMNQHDTYMNDFEKIFTDLFYLGPGSEQDSLKALNLLPYHSGELLEIGCGRGAATRVLAENTEFSVTALDNDQYSLDCLQQNLHPERHTRVKTICDSMTSMKFDRHQFDVIWTEGSAYIMGVEQALKEWKQFLKPEGHLVLSDLIWTTDSPDPALLEYWQQFYPSMATADDNIRIMNQAGYEVIDSFLLSDQAWQNYLLPITETIQQMPGDSFLSDAPGDLLREAEIRKQYPDQYGYRMFIMKNTGGV